MNVLPIDAHQKQSGAFTARTAKRLHHVVPVKIIDVPSTITIDASVADISLRGMRILCSEHLAPETKFHFEIVGELRLMVAGTVRWTRPAPDGWQSGILFTSIDVAGQERLDAFLSPSILELRAS
jgi:hypothetical protein